MSSLALVYSVGTTRHPFNAYKWYLLSCGPEVGNYVGTANREMREPLVVWLKTMEQVQKQEAAQWAADRGSAFGQYILAQMYARGDVRLAPKSAIYAYKWFNLACARSEGALQRQVSRARDRVEAKLTPEQLAEAQRLASEWKPTPI